MIVIKMENYFLNNVVIDNIIITCTRRELASRKRRTSGRINDKFECNITLISTVRLSSTLLLQPIYLLINIICSTVTHVLSSTPVYRRVRDYMRLG